MNAATIFAAIAALLMLAGPARAATSDCAKATSGVDRAICTDPDLQSLDQRLRALYAPLIENATPTIRRALVAQERAWVKHRDTQCASGATPACLAPLYRQRIDALIAMTSAADTDPNGTLSTVTPPTVIGRWRVEPFTLNATEAAIPAPELQKQILHQNLPTAGQVVRGTPQGLCIADTPCVEIGWSHETLASEPGAARLEDDLHLKPDQTILLGRLSGKYSLPIMLLPRASGAMDAIVGVCTQGRTEACRNHLQHWDAINP